MIPAVVREELKWLLGDRVVFDASLSRHTSLRVGGPAEALASPADRQELGGLLALCARHRLPWALLGSGFNTLVLDGGMEGVVIRLHRFRRLEERPGGLLRAEAGVSHGSVARFCIDRGLSGLEFGAGIPGTMGGWVAMNAGIGEREVRDVAVEVEVMSPTGIRIRHLRRSRLVFTYRSLLGLAPGSVILSVLFAVTPTDPAKVRAQVEEHLAHRRQTQPLDLPSCGSVFKNPEGGFAGRLIDGAGLKGKRVGDAVISHVHANFIVNAGHARAADVLRLIRCTRQTVRDRTGIRLEPEVRIVGRA